MCSVNEHSQLEDDISFSGVDSSALCTTRIEMTGKGRFFSRKALRDRGISIYFGLFCNALSASVSLGKSEETKRSLKV